MEYKYKICSTVDQGGDLYADGPLVIAREETWPAARKAAYKAIIDGVRGPGCITVHEIAEDGTEESVEWWDR